MSKRIVVAILVGLSSVLLISCAGFRDEIVDRAAGFPASQLARDIKKTSDEYEQEKHEERVEDLSGEYEEFLQSQGKVGTDEEEAEQSIVIMKEDIDND